MGPHSVEGQTSLCCGKRPFGRGQALGRARGLFGCLTHRGENPYTTRSENRPCALGASAPRIESWNGPGLPSPRLVKTPGVTEGSDSLIGAFRFAAHSRSPHAQLRADRSPAGRRATALPSPSSLLGRPEHWFSSFGRDQELPVWERVGAWDAVSSQRGPLRSGLLKIIGRFCR